MRNPLKVLIAAAMTVTAVAAAPAPALAAPPPTRIVATSPVTGVTYTATWSCAGGQVKIAGVHTNSTPVTMQFQVQPSATGTWLTRQITRAESFDFSTGGDSRNDNGDDQVVIRDGFTVTPFESIVYGPVLTLTIPDCPDYTVGTRNVFRGITPQRVLDTRPGTAVNHTGPKPGPGGIVRLAPEWFPEMPADATAVSITVTGTEASAPGFLQAFPTGGAEPGSSSNVNLTTAGATVANLAVVPLGADRSVSLLTSGGSHLLVDVNGYFVPAPGAVASGRLQTLATQKRMLDTRPETAVNHSGAKPNGSTVTVDLTSLSSGLPVGATAAVVNITATATDAPGFVQVDAGGALVPGAASVVNITGAEQTAAAFSIVPLSATGSIDVYSSAGAHLLVDLIGYFTGPTATSALTGRFVPLPPERVHDTRLESMVNIFTFWDAAGVRTQRVYLAALGQQASAFFVNATVTGNQAPGFLALGASSGVTQTSSLNMPTPNTTAANAAIVKGSNNFSYFASSASHVIINLAGYFTV